MSARRGRRRVRAGVEESVRGSSGSGPDPSQLLQSLTRLPLNLNFNSCNSFINTACTPPITCDPLARRPSRGRTPTRSYSPYHRNRSSSRSSSERNWSRRRRRSNSHHHRRRRRRSNSHRRRRRRRRRRSSSSSYSSYSDSSNLDSSNLDSSNSDSSNSDIVREQPILYSRSPSPYRSPVRPLHSRERSPSPT